MADKGPVEHLLTLFLQSTCRYRRHYTRKYAINAAIWCALLDVPHLNDDYCVKIIPVVTGSVAEFYIDPMVPHIGDIDIMFHTCNQLAIPQGYPLPTQLPAEFEEYVKVYEILDSRLPGYVYLKSQYLLTKCTDSGRYNAKENKERDIKYTVKVIYIDNPRWESHGPAYQLNPIRDDDIDADIVYCIRCLSWPPQAADWPTRHRKYGRPDAATVDCVVSNGCDVVYKADRRLWRLSFSRAEITLIDSWSHRQQICYHLLRVLMKTKQLTQSADTSGEKDDKEEGKLIGTLSNYHNKTLMLWASELKPNRWWTDDYNLVSVCVDLLHILADWLSEARCPHYFINDCNLVDESFPLDTIASRLRSIDRDWLFTWFVNSYLRESVRVCPESISRLFDDVSSNEKLERAVFAFIEWRNETREVDRWCEVNRAEYFIARTVSRFSEYDPRGLTLLMQKLAETNHHTLSLYSACLMLLHIANRIMHLTGPMNETLMEAVSIAANDYLFLSDVYYRIMSSSLRHSVDMASRNCQQMEKSLADCNKSELVELLQQSAVGLLTTFLEREMRDFGSVATIAITVFEALYTYKHGDYQQCLQLSTENIWTLLNAECTTYIPALPEFIQLMDDDIASLTALTLIVNDNCRNDRRYDAIVTQLVLSLYFMSQCQLKLGRSVMSLVQILDCIKHTRKIHDDRLTLDHLILKLTESKLVKFLITYTTACPESISRLFDDVSSRKKLESAVSDVIGWKKETREVDRWHEVNRAEYFLAQTVSGFSDYDPRGLCFLTQKLAETNHHTLSLYSACLMLLHIANRIMHLTGPMNETLMELKALSVAANDYLVLSGGYYEEISSSLRHNMDMANHNCQQMEKSLADRNKSELVELLQQFAVGLLTTFLEHEVRDFGSVATIAITVFDALYAYKCGDYQQCLQLSTENIWTLLNAECTTYIPALPEFIQLMDDDIVSVTALTLIVNDNCRNDRRYDAMISQLVLSLYLMTRCQLKLGQSVTLLVQLLDYIENTRKIHDDRLTLDHLILKLTECKLVKFLITYFMA